MAGVRSSWVAAETCQNRPTPPKMAWGGRLWQKVGNASSVWHKAGHSRYAPLPMPVSATTEGEHKRNGRERLGMLQLEAVVEQKCLSPTGGVSSLSVTPCLQFKNIC